MKIGIKQKILFVLVGVLALSTVLNVLLASFFTNRQNEDAAFASLRNDLLAWQSDLQTMTRQLRGVALATVRDVAILNQLGEIITLEFSIEDPARGSDRREIVRTLGYRKTVSLNRLQLALRTGGFSSIAVHTGGRLSHFISASEAGMSVKREDGRPAWITATADAKGDLPFQSWPAWKDQAPPAGVALRDPPRQTRVSFIFPESGDTVMEIAVPVQGYADDVLTDSTRTPVERYFTELSVPSDAGAGNPKSAGAGQPGQTPRIFAVVVFRKLIDRAMLESVARKTGKSPVLLSPDGRHRQTLDGPPVIPPDIPEQAQGLLSAEEPVPLQRSVSVGHESFYVAVLPWRFENQPRLMLALSSPRANTLHNIRQTVVAILVAAGATMLLSVAVGLWWVKRFMDPIVELTSAVKGITSGRRDGDRPPAQALESLQPVDIRAPDEVGALAKAFNDMVAELQHSFETLEHRVQARTAELRQQARYLRTLIDMLPMWAWFKDTESRFLAVNRAAAETHGLRPDDVVGKSDHDLFPGDLADAFRADDVEVMTSRQQKTIEETQRVRGGTIWLETFKAPVLDDDGTVLGTVGVARDISERKAAEAAREAALAEAQRLARMRSEFLAQMSHELRTPLNGILGFAQILQRDKSLSEAQAKGVKVIDESGRHLLRLIDDILDLARIDAGKLVIDPQDVDLPAFLQGVCDIVGVKAEEKNLVFTFRAEGMLPAGVRTDAQRLRQVLLNLLSNAIKFTDRGQVTLTVQALPPDAQPTVNGPGSNALVRLRFEVKDSGIGMTQAQLDRLFQPFEQVADAHRREGGTGLGLAISRRLIRMMGGDIHVRSRPGEGSVFFFEIVLPTAQSLSTVARRRGRPIGYEGPRKKVLVIDDVPQNREMMFEALSSLGIQAIGASDGQMGIDVAVATRPDLIVIDAMMPVMDGWEATRRLRQIPALAAVPIIATSASATPEVEARCRAAGASTFIAKPIEQNVLLDALARLMGLTWVYEEPEPSPAASAGKEGADASMVYPPPEEMQVLRQLARRGNMRSVRERAEHLRQLDPRYEAFAARLAALAEACQSRAITALVEGDTP